MRPQNPTPSTTAETPAVAALHIAQDRHAREIQAVKEQHAQDLQTLREEMKCVHEVEIIEAKMALYAEHKRDLLELKEGRERELERLRAFFAAVRARGDSEVAGSAALSPAGGATGVLPGQACSTGARTEAAAASSSPAPGPAPTSSSASSSPTPPPEIPPTAAPISPQTPSSPPPPRPGTARAAAPHVRFLTTGITPAEAKSKAKSVRVEKEAGGSGAGNVVTSGF